MILFRNVSLSRGNQQPVLVGQRFSEEKWQFLLDVKQTPIFTDENQRTKFAKVSTFINNYYCRTDNNNSNNNPKRAHCFVCVTCCEMDTSGQPSSVLLSDDCARGDDTSSSRSMRPWSRLHSAQRPKTARAGRSSS